MIGIECNNNNEVTKVVNKLASINNINETSCKKLTEEIIYSATKTGYPVTIIKNFDNIEFNFDVNEKDIDTIPYREFLALNLFKRVPTRYVETFLNFMNVVPNLVSVKTIKLILEEHLHEIETKTEAKNEKYSTMVGKYFQVTNVEENEVYYMEVLDYDMSRQYFTINYILVNESQINPNKNTTWYIDEINNLSLKEITKEKYNTITEQYTNMISTLFNTK